MKFDPALVKQVLGQIDAEAIPDEHPMLPTFRGVFGDHTFFLDCNGLNIIEPVERKDRGFEAAQVVNLASWIDGDPPTLERHEPEPTEVIIVLGYKH